MKKISEICTTNTIFTNIPSMCPSCDGPCLNPRPSFASLGSFICEVCHITESRVRLVAGGDYTRFRIHKRIQDSECWNQSIPGMPHQVTLQQLFEETKKLMETRAPYRMLDGALSNNPFCEHDMVHDWEDLFKFYGGIHSMDKLRNYFSSFCR